MLMAITIGYIIFYTLALALRWVGMGTTEND